MTEFTEYDGGGVMPNTVYPKAKEALTNGDKLRLQSITGQEEDSQASPDPGFWHGNEYFDVNQPAYTYKEHDRKVARAMKEEQARYKETKRPRQSY